MHFLREAFWKVFQEIEIHLCNNLVVTGYLPASYMLNSYMFVITELLHGLSALQNTASH